MSTFDGVDKLVFEMGFNRAEAKMALTDAGGDINQAIEKLLAGDYAPPPYTPAANQEGIEQQSSAQSDCKGNSTLNQVSNFLTDLTRPRSKVPTHPEDNPTAPSFYDLSSQLQNIELPESAKQLPPPYEIVNKNEKVKSWEEESNVFHLDLNTCTQQLAVTNNDRCSVCFSVLKTQVDVLSQNGKYYHGDCFRRKFGPKCAHCCFPLSMPDKDHDLSGRYLVYNNKDYHVECYAKYAGPRCTFCFNVIIVKPNGEFSGSWIVDGNSQYHTECYQKKLQNLWKAKNS